MTSQQNPAILELRGVTKTYNVKQGLFGAARPLTAVNDVSLSLPRGEVLGLVGESGCGKSTLTRAILGLESVQGGEIRAFGHSVGRGFPNALRAGIQVVFQDPYGSFNPRWKVARLVAEPFHLMAARPDDWRDRVARVLTDVGMEPDAMDRYIHEFSGGQRQRIAIARAVAMKPDLLVADEAVSALDVSVQAQVLDLLADVQKRFGIAMLFITHDLRVAAQICDDVLVMQKGRVVEHGPAAEVLLHPGHAYTRSLIEAAPGREWDFANFRALPAQPQMKGPHA